MFGPTKSTGRSTVLSTGRSTVLHVSTGRSTELSTGRSAELGLVGCRFKRLSGTAEIFDNAWDIRIELRTIHI